jgi:glycosyltransferase involved in cell wall biosynthesis
MTALTLVLSGFNEGPTLGDSLERILLALRRLGEPFEVVAIDDASGDATAAVLESFAARPDVEARFVRHAVNQGRGATVREGMALARGDVVGFCDVDLEVGPEYIAPFYDAIRGGADLAIGRRIYSVSPRTLHRHVLSRAYVRLVRWRLGLPYHDTEAGYKFFSPRAARLAVDETRDPGWFWDTEVVATAHRHGLRVVEIPCLFVRRQDKESSVRVVRDSLAYLRSLRRYSARPRS